MVKIKNKKKNAKNKHVNLEDKKEQENRTKESGS